MILLTVELPHMFVWKSHAGFGRRSYNPMQKEREYVQWQLKTQYSSDLLTCPIRVSYDFFFTPPKSISKKKREAMLRGEIKHIVRPDCTNILKMFEDSLKGVVIKDDSIVFKTEVEKHYSEKCHVIIKIYPIE